MKATSRWIAITAILLVGKAGQSMIGDTARTWDAGRPKDLLAPMETLPMQIDEWVGRDDPPGPEVVAAMKDDLFLQRVYRHPSGQEVIVFLCFSKSGRDSYHYPTVCMKGKGWTEEESQRKTLTADDTGETSSIDSPKVRFRFVNERKERQVVYYWYYLIGESPIDEAMRVMSRSARLFLRGRTNAGLTVELFSRTSLGTVVDLDHFAHRLAEEIAPLLPRHSRGECELGANL